MNNFVRNPPEKNHILRLSNDWNHLIKQLKSQNVDKTEFPPILSQRKSSLQGYKSNHKLTEQSKSKDKTITQKILDLSKKRKVSTIDINQSINDKKKYFSQHCYTFTEEQKQLLSSKQIKRSLVFETQKKKPQLNNAKDIIRQIKALQLTQKKKEKQRELFKREKKVKIPLTILNQDQQTNTRPSLPELKVHERQITQTPTSMQKNRKLSFEVSKNERSLRFHCQQFNQQIPRLLLKKRKIKQGVYGCLKQRFRPANSTKTLKHNSEQCNQQINQFQEQKPIESPNFIQNPPNPQILKPAKKSSKKQKTKTTEYEPWIDKSNMQLQDIQMTIQNYSNKITNDKFAKQ